MTQAQSKSYGGVKKKLMGAICMLLVASIMVVSSTYAWFTLSTAPEITGISTSVGANGNLEMALLNTQTFANPDLIKSAVGDSMDAEGKNVTAANVTWGNLINLSDPSYGLTDIALYPAALNIEGGKLADSPLKTPTYGSDGRVTGTNANTASAIKGDNGWTIYYGNQDYGVRAVGTADGLTARQIALNNAKRLFNSYLSGASSKVIQAINENAGGLLALQTTNEEEALNSDSAEMVYALTQAVNTAVGDIANAYRQAIIAAAAASDSLTDDKFTTAETAIKNAAFSDLATVAGEYTPSAVSGNLAVVSTMVTDAATALNAVKTLKDNEGSTAKQYKEAAAKIVDTSLMTGSTSNLAAGFTIENGTATCILGDIADLAGTYTTKIMNGVTSLTVKQHTDKATSVKTAVSSLTASTNTSTAGQTLNDMYGYIIDFVFRTNAATSNLQLQTAGVNRVYNDAEGADLAAQGAGSYLSFAGANMGEEQVKNIMRAVRVVFFNPDDGSYYAEAAIKEDFTGAGSTFKAPLYLIDSITTVTTTTTVLGRDAYEVNTNGDYKLDNVKYPAASEVVNDGVKTITKYTNYAPVITAKAWQALPTKTINYVETSEEYNLQDDASAITSLTQNTAMKVSALVFIDGNLVDNGDTVNAATAGALSMNLQFSSSADLVPMGNTSLKEMVSSDIDAGSAKITLSGDNKKASVALGKADANETILSTTWLSSDTSVATIDKDGSVTTKENGETTLVAIVKTERNVYTAMQKLIVTTPSTGASIILKDEQPVTSITLATEKNASYDKETTLSLKLNPEKTTDVLDATKGVKWSVLANTAVEVDANSGKLTANAVTENPVTVTATYYVQDNETPKTATVDVKVVKAAADVDTMDAAESGNAMTSATLQRDSAKVASDIFYLSIPKEGEKVVDKIKDVQTFFADDALAASESSVNTGAATITVTAKNPTVPGKTTMLAVITTENGGLIFKSYTVEVKVNPFAAGDISLTNDSAPLTSKGATTTISLNANSTDAKCDDRIKSVTWTSSDPSVATVSGTNESATVTVVADSTEAAAVNKTVTITAKVTTYGGLSIEKTANVQVNIA